MTQPTDDTRHERLRLHEVASLDDHAFDLYIEERFDQLVTAAIADADGRLRPEQHTALHAPGRLLQLHDALTFAQGDLQVAAERMTYHGDARAARTARLLRRVRTALHEVTRKTTAVRREEGRQREAEATPPSNDVIVMARNWLVDALPHDFNRLLTRTFAEAGFPLRPAAADVFGTVEEGWDDGLLTEPRTQQVDELLAKGAVAFRGLVADDVRSQNARTTALRHPLLQRRWAQALDELAELTIPVAQASSSSALGALPAGVYDLPETDAYKVFNGRRFLTAVWQRQAEHKHLLRHYALTVTERRRSSPEHDRRRRAVETAIDQLVNQQPVAASRIVIGLCPHITGDGLIELPPGERAGLKRQLVAEARAAAVPTRTPDTAPPPPAPAPRPVPAASAMR